MRLGITIVSASLMSILAGCAAGASQQQHASTPDYQCAALGDVSEQVTDLYTNKVTDVKPAHRKEFIARAIQPRIVAGAEMYVPAEPGMSAAYLDRVMSCHVASGAGQHPNDPLHVAAIERVDVDEVGSHFRVTVTGPDRAAGKAIYEAARALEPSGSVQVQQIASADDQSTL